MKLKYALMAAAGSFAICSAASADEGWYGALGAGYTFESDDIDFESDDSRPGSPSPSAPAGPGSDFGFNADYDLDSALNIYGAFGRYLSHGFRGELEFAYREQDINAITSDDTGNGFGGVPGDDIGDVSFSNLMLNVYKDFDMGGGFTPYIGAGVGVGWFRSEVNNFDPSRPFASSTADPYTVVVADRDTVAAYQGMIGLAFDLAENIDLDLRYRHLRSGEADYGGFVNGPPASFDSEYVANELTAGLRWNFSAPPAPAPAPVTYKNCPDGSRVVSSANCPPVIVETVDAPEDLSFTVYFDFDKSNLSDPARRVISENSSDAMQYDINSVSVQGNTDTVGSNAYNNALSARRAGVVRDALVSDGIPSGLIDVDALGESNLAKQTADGVREPLNRRTDVFFTFD